MVFIWEFSPIIYFISRKVNINIFFFHILFLFNLSRMLIRPPSYENNVNKIAECVLWGRRGGEYLTFNPCGVMLIKAISLRKCHINISLCLTPSISHDPIKITMFFSSQLLKIAFFGGGRRETNLFNWKESIKLIYDQQSLISIGDCAWKFPIKIDSWLGGLSPKRYEPLPLAIPLVINR